MKDGTLLQSGTIVGLPTSGFLGGDFAPIQVPVPGSLVLLGLGALGIVSLKLRRCTAA